MNKFFRLGFTECTLVMLKHATNIVDNVNDKFVSNCRRHMLWHLYRSAGVYDKDVTWVENSKDFTIHEHAEPIIRSETYNTLLEEWWNAIHNSDLLQFNCHYILPINTPGYTKEALMEKMDSYLPPHIDVALCTQDGMYHRSNHQGESFGLNIPYGNSLRPHVVAKQLEGKNILIVNNFASHIQKWIKSSGNKISLPRHDVRINNVYAVDTPCNFFNTGPGSNCLSTLDIILDKCSKYNYDIAIVAVGGISIPIATRLSAKQAVYTVGSLLRYIFPFKGEVPLEYRPKRWSEIEEGRYWTDIHGTS
jgi:hypothetical protein